MKNFLLSCLCSVLTCSSFAQAGSEDTQVAMQLVTKHARVIGLTDEDLRNSRVSSTYQTTTDGIRMLYLQQTYLGYPVHNTMHVLAFRNGQLVSVAGSRVKQIESKVAAERRIAVVPAPEAVKTALANAGVPAGGLSPAGRMINGKLNFGKTPATNYDIIAEQVWVPVSEKEVRLAWEVEVAPASSSDHWMIRVDAFENKVIDRNNYTVHEHFDEHVAGDISILSNESPAERPVVAEGPLAVNSASYRVIPFPAESPIHTGGTQALVTDPWTLSPGNATSLGWHYDGSVYHDSTRGNNVWAQEDRDNSNSTFGRAARTTTPQPNLTLNNSYNFSLAPTDSVNQLMAITNLFYWNNLTHDITYLYGFDEPSGNFQNSNQGRGGLGNDYVIADAQDAGGTNNANFSTPVDGSRPRMQMYLWNTATPNRDGDLDNGIIIHEYGHGISNRLTGGPANSSCLGNAEQAGEGWSDYLALMYTTNWATALPTDGTVARGIGTYALNQATTGQGIRLYRYSTNMAVNPWTYAMMATNTGGAVHRIGELWCTMLWEMTWEMIAQDGINPNIFNPSGTGGNTAALKLVIEGMRLQPCSPGFVDSRNAILRADTIFFGGKYSCAIWKAFAKRGLGRLASQGSSNSYTDQVASFVDQNSPALQLIQSVSSQQEGLTVTYTNRVTAGLCSAANNHLITDTLPSNVNYVSGGTYNASNRVVSFSVNLAAGQTQDYSFTVQLALGSYFVADTILNERVAGTAGTIPAGWTASSTTSTVWTTHNTRSFSAPNSFFTPNITTASEQTLASSGSYSLGPNPREFSFWHWYNSEAGWDGGVVEISTNGGSTWTDLGSRMTQNGYNGVLGATGGVLASRSAFNGNSGTFVKTVVDLASFANQSVRFRFRFVSDASVGGTGWNVDDIVLAGLAARVTMKSNLFTGAGVAVTNSSVSTVILPGPCTGGAGLPVINTQPVAQVVCDGESASFSVAASGTDLQYQWQVSTDGGNQYVNISGQTSSSLTINSSTVSLNGNRYRCLVINLCSPAGVPSSEATLTVNARPAPAQVTGGAVCGSGSVALSATAQPNEAIDWYAGPTGGIALVTGSTTYQTPFISNSTTYYTETRNTITGCISSARTPVLAQVNTLPAAPSPSGGIAVCGSGSVNLTAIPGQSETIDWYSTASGGTALLTGSSSFTTPVLTSSTIYYAQARNTVTGCVSATRTSITATVNAVPQAPLGQNGSRCGQGNVQLSATVGAGQTVDWFVVPSGGLAVSTGSLTYNTGTLLNSTTYYAETRVTATGCRSSSRTAVTATINQASSSTTSVTICNTQLPYEWNNQVYTSGGSYSVTLTNSIGCDSIATLLLDIAPQIQLFNVTGGGSYPIGSGGVAIGLSGSQVGVNYQLIRDGNINVGAPVAGTGQAISFGNQTSAGVYIVSASSPFCSNFMNNSVTVTVTAPVEPAVFTVTGGGTYCQGGAGVEVGLSGSETGVSYQLFRNSGTIAVGAAVSGTGSAISFGLQTTAGDYSVLATNISSSITRFMQNSVVVRMAQLRTPSAPGTVTGPTDVCNFVGGAPVVYRINQASNATSYLWTAPAGATIVGSNTDTAVSISYPQSFVSGTLSVVSVNGCFNNAVSGARSITIRKNVPTTPGTIATTVTNPCSIVGTNNTAIYTIRKVAFATGYNWSLSSGIVLVSNYGDTGVVVRFNAGFTSGFVSVQATNACATSSARTLTITATRPSTPVAITGPSAVCAFAGQQPVVYSIAPVSGATSYIWTVSGNASIASGQGTTQVAVQVNSNFTTGVLAVSAASNCGTSTSRSLSLTATRPAAPAAISGPAQVCEFVSQSTTATYSIAPVAGASGYTWTVPVNSSIVSGQGTTSIQLSFSQAFSSGTLSVRSDANCGSSSNRSMALTKLVTRPGAITASASPCPGATVTYSVAPVTGATSYLWTPPANSTYVSGQGTNSYTVTFSPSFTTGIIYVRSQNACSNSSAVSLSLSASSCIPSRNSFVSEQPSPALQLVDVYPNPSSGQFVLSLTGSDYTGRAKVQLLDLAGRVVLDKPIQVIKSMPVRLVVQTGSIPSGMYELRYIEGSRFIATRKIIISR